MNTTPTLTQAFPAIAARIDADRPILAHAIPHLRVASIEDNKVVLVCNDPPTSELLSSSSQGSYFAELFNNHYGRPITLELNHLPPGCELTEFTGTRVEGFNPAPSPTAPKRTSNALTFHERKALESWMQQPDNTHFVANESDADAARQASKALDPVHVTAANIASMRKLLGIEKIKPEKPAPLPPELNLSCVQGWINQHSDDLAELRVQATGMKATIAELHNRLKTVIELHNQTATPGCCIPPLSDLPVS